MHNETLTNIPIYLRPAAGLFYRSSNFVPKKVLTLLYYSFIHSKLCYSIESWRNTSRVHLQRLIQFQKKIVRIINRKPCRFPTKDLFKTLDILTVDELYKYKILVQAHKLFYSLNSSTSAHYSTRYQLLSLPVPFH